jgi:hypothetical protein
MLKEIWINKLIACVNPENIFQHVRELEGIRHPLKTPEALEKAADYIKKEFKNYSLAASEHQFYLDGFKKPFRNIQASLSGKEDKRPILLITSHYDTVRESPGANDNASGTAVMLEAARVLKLNALSRDIPLDVRFVSFTLEEAYPEETIHNAVALWQGNFRVRRYKLISMIKQIKSLALYTINIAQAKEKAFSLLDHYKKILTKAEQREFKEITNLIFDYRENRQKIAGKYTLVGSLKYLEHLKNASIEGIINLETIGCTRKDRHSQKLPRYLYPPLLRLLGRLKSHHTRWSLDRGDWIAVISNLNSSKLGKLFYRQTKRKKINLPATWLHVPLNFRQIARYMPDLLRSDQASFWKHGHPGLLITDTANFRYPYYHTRADTYEKCDFDFMTKICRAVAATVAEMIFLK